MQLHDRHDMQLQTTRNPFGVRDVTEPFGADVMEFASKVVPSSRDQDPNASQWGMVRERGTGGSLESAWSSRWNGGAAGHVWREGRATLRSTAAHIYILFDWDDGASCGLIEARQEDARRLVGKYVNLGNPGITRAWVGFIVDENRIDGHWVDGRLDFRR
jgi:hypothetical protein